MGRLALGRGPHRDRPLGGALIAVTTFGETSAPVTGLIALLGGTVAASTHATKAGTRAVATSPEPFSNWILSFTEDLFVVGLGFVAECPARRAGHHGRSAAADCGVRGNDLAAVQEALSRAVAGYCAPVVNVSFQGVTSFALSNAAMPSWSSISTIRKRSRRPENLISRTLVPSR